MKLKRRRYANIKERQYVLRRDLYLCRYCGKTLVWQSANIDHVDSFSAGGPTHISNLVASCQQCNKDKGNWSDEPIPLEQLVNKMPEGKPKEWRKQVLVKRFRKENILCINCGQPAVIVDGVGNPYCEKCGRRRFTTMGWQRQVAQHKINRKET